MNDKRVLEIPTSVMSNEDGTQTTVKDAKARKLLQQKPDINDASASSTTVYSSEKIESLKGTSSPKMDGTAAVGTSAKYAREDHVHPTDVSDSGWLYLNYTSPFANHSDDTANRPAYRKYGKVVQIRGTATVSSQIPADTTTRTMFTLPSGYRPARGLQILCQGTNYNKWLLGVGANGIVTHSRYGGTSGATTNVGNWLPFSVTFLVD